MLNLVKQKGVYSYEYMDSFKKCLDEKLPDRCKFYNSLKNECISKKDYIRTIDVWNVFKINTMGDYFDLHLKTDVLVYVFVKFIDTCLEYYELDNCQYFRSPELISNAMLKMSEIKLKLVSDTKFIYWKRNERSYFLHC